jgi:recombination protein RecA
VDKRGAFFRYNDGLIGQGRENAKQYLRENPELAYEIEMLIREAFRAMPLTTSSRTSDNGDDDGGAGDDAPPLDE